mmetsp:Transcript_23941/g.58517  ORF Transcript_23941/g.58517 Transcript_23941/m.58517 type:complete len:102 (+) Transcript_23941:509-814(+)
MERQASASSLVYPATLVLAPEMTVGNKTEQTLLLFYSLLYTSGGILYIPSKFSTKLLPSMEVSKQEKTGRQLLSLSFHMAKPTIATRNRKTVASINSFGSI